jgi:hypothetical protein
LPASNPTKAIRKVAMLIRLNQVIHKTMTIRVIEWTKPRKN